MIKMKKKRNKKIIIIISSVVGLILILVLLFMFLLSPAGKSNKTINFEVKKGEKTEVIVGNLKSAGLIRSKYASLIYMILTNNKNLQAGSYELSKDMSATDIIKSINNGNIKEVKKPSVKITFKEGTTLKNYIKQISEETNIDYDEAIKKVYFKSAKYFNIPGFRKGKAPMQMVEKQYGASIFYEDTFNELVPEIYDEAIKANNVEAVSRPQIDIQQMEKGKNLIFTAIVQVIPEVKLGKYKGIELNKIEYNVSDEDIEHELGHMQEKNSRIVTVEDRPVEPKDITVIDFEGFVDGKAFDGGKAEKHELEIGSNTFIPGFEDQIIGMRIEEEKDINVKFPEEYFSKDLAGKDATFKVKLHEIKKKELPELDDEFAKDVSEFDTLEELKNSIKEKIQTENDSRAKYETEESAIKAVCENTTIDIPSAMIDNEIENMIQDVKTRLSYQGLSIEQYLKMINKTEADMRNEFKEQAERSVKSRLVLDAIAKAEKLENSEEEIAEKIKEMAENYGKKEEELLKNEQLKNYLEENMKTEKAIKFIVENAKIK